MEYMTVKEAAELWGYSMSSVRKWCADGKIVLTIRPEKRGNKWLIPRNASCPGRKKKK